MDYDSYLELVKKRRSMRRFKTDPIPDDYVEKIIEAARWAPSGANSQPWEFVVIKEKGLKDQIVEILLGSRGYYKRVELTRDEDLRFPTVSDPPAIPGYTDAPVFIILCGDPRTREAYPRMANLTRGEFIFESSQASAFLYMNLAATALGLGSQWVSASAGTSVQPLVKQQLGIPQDYEIYDMMAVGYPALEPRPRLVREREEMIHYGRYDMAKYRSDEQVREFIVSLRKG
jgi:nitroreductase